MIGSYLGVLCLNFILLVFFVESMKWNPYLSQFLALGAAVFVSFLAQKYIVFRPRKF
jgi:putative flippase GtrA